MFTKAVRLNSFVILILSLPKEKDLPRMRDVNVAMKAYYVYILTNKSHTLYTGMTNNLDRRFLEHVLKEKKNSFTAKYNIDKLIFYNEFRHATDAIAAEKKIKGWTRKKKIALIKSMNPEFTDLFRLSQTS